MAKIEAKADVATNFNDRPVTKRKRHNVELESKILREAGPAGPGTAGQGPARRVQAGHGRQGMAGASTHDKASLDEDRPGMDRQGRLGPTAEDLLAAPGKKRPEAPPASPKKSVAITAPNFLEVVLHVEGTSPYVQHAFSQKALLQIEETHRAGSQSRTRKKREARDFEADYENAKHRSLENWHGIPAPAFRNALISACKIVGFFQTRAKLALFVVADGIDAVDGTPMIKIIGEPEIHKGWGRNESGTVDLRWRPMWKEWSADVRIRYDADMFSVSDIVHLMMRAGLQVGIGEGRADSPNSNGMGWGSFRVAS